jgi:hypothetical protein
LRMRTPFQPEVGEHLRFLKLFQAHATLARETACARWP